MELAEELHSFSVVGMYEAGLSATEIMNFVRERCPWFRPIKSIVLAHLAVHGVERRGTREAMASYYDRHDIWNKDETKATHASVARYAGSRTGDKNPIHTLSPEQRSAFNHLNVLKATDPAGYEAHKQRLSRAVTSWFSDEANKAGWRSRYDEARPKQRENVVAGVRRYYERYAALGSPAPNKVIKVSRPEALVKAALELLGVDFDHQWYFARASWDFRLRCKPVLLEVNGDYWHAHESCFPDAGAIHPDRKVTVAAVRQAEGEKHARAEQHGFKVVVVWEYELTGLPRAMELVKERCELE